MLESFIKSLAGVPWLELLITGTVKGSMYALIALGYTMVYGILQMINFANGEIFMIGMFATVFGIALLSSLWGSFAAINLILGVVFAVILASAYGYGSERIAYRRLRNAHILAPLTSAIGLSIVLQQFISNVVGNQPFTFPNYYSDPFAWRVVTLVQGNPATGAGDVGISMLQVCILTTACLLMTALFYMIHCTRVGIAMRAVSQDRLMASLVGIPVNHVIAFTFIVGSSLAAVAGTLFSMYTTTLTWSAGTASGLKAFTAAIIGGIGNIPGAVLGGLLIGIIEDFTIAILGAQWRNVILFAILMLTLILRPRGLLGERVADKV
ncbi:branched-chain amino acid ABC transporter permease LivH [Verrucomicrobia bacterium LW23]|nr:branched-chain amino acid ABC transporter permease LivH [Verrucomicrobia bacterium LW23]